MNLEAIIRRDDINAFPWWPFLQFFLKQVMIGIVWHSNQICDLWSWPQRPYELFRLISVYYRNGKTSLTSLRYEKSPIRNPIQVYGCGIGAWSLPCCTGNGITLRFPHDGSVKDSDSLNGCQVNGGTPWPSECRLSSRYGNIRKISL
jgi:hypothetical protein